MNILLADHTNTLTEKAPVMQERAPGKPIKFKKPSEDWAAAKNWQFSQIQILTNLLVSTYGATPPFKGNPSAANKVRFAYQCGVACEFFPKTEKDFTKDHIKAHLQSWLSELQIPGFIGYMSKLWLLLGRPSHPKECTILQNNFILAKSALKFLSPTGSAQMKQVVEMLVQYKLE